MDVTKFGHRYTLTKPLRAVKLGAQVNGKSGIITEIPNGSTIEVDSGKKLPGMMNVIWQGERYALFPCDLMTRAVPAVLPGAGCQVQYHRSISRSHSSSLRFLWSL